MLSEFENSDIRQWVKLSHVLENIENYSIIDKLLSSGENRIKYLYPLFKTVIVRDADRKRSFLRRGILSAYDKTADYGKYYEVCFNDGTNAASQKNDILTASDIVLATSFLVNSLSGSSTGFWRDDYLLKPRILLNVIKDVNHSFDIDGCCSKDCSNKQTLINTCLSQCFCKDDIYLHRHTWFNPPFNPQFIMKLVQMIIHVMKHNSDSTTTFTLCVPKRPCFSYWDLLLTHFRLVLELPSDPNDSYFINLDGTELPAFKSDVMIFTTLPKEYWMRQFPTRSTFAFNNIGFKRKQMHSNVVGFKRQDNIYDYYENLSDFNGELDKEVTPFRVSDRSYLHGRLYSSF